MKFTTVFDFPGAAAKPGVALVKASDGNFYGTTNTEGAYGVGAIYRVTPQGQIATIYSFKGGSDGYSPSSSLLVGPDGNLWGTTSFNNDNTTYGTIYKVTLKGVLTTVHTFTGPDGRYPATELLNGGDGKLYGTVESGFSVGGSYPLYGAIYSITPSGTFKLAYSFKFADAGVAPMAGLIKGKDGFLYGTTSRTSSGFKGGSIFKFDPATSSLTTVYSFKPNSDGSAPGKIVQGKDGNFYGTTTTDGNGASSGAKAFRVTPSGTFTVLHSFDTAANGYPSGVALVQASDGNFYGTCANGGKDGYGVVYRLTPSGTFAIVHAFPAVPVGVLTAALEGANPDAPLIDGGDGFLYGTTSNGAGDREIVFRGDGTVFKIALNGTFQLVAPFFSAPDGKDPHSAL
ncbi:MAG: choice-of-anchor tandem repeat GloVer-containing protein, partial [Chthoniobacterales bacterium]